jgi:hypothetical protein
MLLCQPVGAHAAAAAAAAAAVICYWAGPEIGLKYALNTPGLLGCSGSVAAISSYKAFLEPLGVPHLGIPLPIPVVLFTLVYCCLFVREQVRQIGQNAVMRAEDDRQQGRCTASLVPSAYVVVLGGCWECVGWCEQRDGICCTACLC